MTKKHYQLLMLAYICLALGFSSCLSAKHSDETDEIVDIHTSQMSVNWAGIYTGILPSARGPEIDVQIIIYYDETYALRYHYLNPASGGVVRLQGTFRWDAAGNSIILDVDDFIPRFQVGSNQMTQFETNRILEKIQEFDWS